MVVASEDAGASATDGADKHLVALLYSFTIPVHVFLCLDISHLFLPPFSTSFPFDLYVFGINVKQRNVKAWSNMIKALFLIFYD